MSAINNERDKKEFIIAYNRSDCTVMSVECGWEGLRFKDIYKRDVLSRYPDAKYGDVVTWNNSFWGSVYADNCMDALREFFKKQEAHERSEYVSTKKEIAVHEYDE